jgi:hypothetical protein
LVIYPEGRSLDHIVLLHYLAWYFHITIPCRDSNFPHPHYNLLFSRIFTCLFVFWDILIGFSPIWENFSECRDLAWHVYFFFPLIHCTLCSPVWFLKRCAIYSHTFSSIDQFFFSLISFKIFLWFLVSAVWKWILKCSMLGVFLFVALCLLCVLLVFGSWICSLVCH